MRVLMFGWEFPPHISGGLGTACYGLTRSLVGQRVDLTFVVPKLYGSENADNLRLVSASEVTIPLPVETSDKNIIPEKSVKTRTTIGDEVVVPGKERVNKETTTYTQVEVASAILPYNTVNTVTETAYSIERWNYVFEPEQRIPVAQSTAEEGDRPIEEKNPQPIGYRYNFSGTYGANLLAEVDAYATVGESLAREYPHDIIHAHDWMTFPAGISAKHFSGKPLVIHVHATEFDRSGALAGPVYEIEKAGMENADKIVAVSNWTKEIIATHYGISRDKVEVVHNGVITSGSNGNRQPQRIGSHVVTFLGRVTHQKGPAYFVEAARKVLERFPDAHFVIAGSGDLLPQTIERVAQLRMSQHFHFTGFLNKEWIDRIWSMSNVYVMPSVSEPFGITPLEAIQAGVPVIVSNQSGVAEVMPHALKVNFWDIDALASSICSVLQYDSLSSMLKKRGEKEIKKLTWNNAAIKLKSLYEELTP